MDFKKLQVDKGYEVLADLIREQILTGEITMGEALPNERDLGTQTGLSRGSVREALRVLEAQGLISTTLGRYGGRTALEPGPGLLGTSLEFLIRGNQVPFSSVLETIEIVEPSLASLAAERRTDADLTNIHKTAKEMSVTDSPSRFHELNAEWHIAVAAGSRSPILAAILRVLGQRLHDPHVEDFASDEVRGLVLKAHEGIEAAIVARDPDAASRRMARHVRAYRLRVQKLAPRTVPF